MSPGQKSGARPDTLTVRQLKNSLQKLAQCKKGGGENRPQDRSCPHPPEASALNTDSEPVTLGLYLFHKGEENLITWQI